MAASLEKAQGADGADIVGRHRRLPARAALISALTLVSRVLGFVREYLSAILFGDRSPIYDAFVTAWRVPNLFRRFLGEGALATSLQTAMTEADGDLGDEAGRALFLDTLRVATAILLGVTLLAMVGVAQLPDTMPVTGWHWLGADPAPVREMTVRLMPFLTLVCLAALVSGGLQVRGHFATPSWAPAIMNVVWIGSLVYVGYRFGWLATSETEAQELARHLDMARTLGWGVLLAGVAQLLIQVPALARFGLTPRRGGARIRVRGPSVWTVLRTSVPLAIGAAAYQINVLIDGLMAEALLPDGGPTTLYFANRIQQFPLALVAVAATSAVFPSLKALGYRKEHAELRRLHDRTQGAVLFWAVPAAVGLFVLALPTAQVLLQHGAFSEDGARRTASALAMLCAALPAAGAVGLVGRTFYALDDFRTPVAVSLVMLGLNASLNVLFVVSFHMDVDGLALATTVSSWGTLIVLLPILVRRLPAEASARSAPGWPRTIASIVFASALCGIAAGWVRSVLAGALGEATALGVAMASGALVYGVATALLGLPESRRAARAVLGRGRPGSG